LFNALLPAYLIVYNQPKLPLLFLFFSVNILIAFFLSKIYFRKRYLIEYQTQTLEERLNILKDEGLKERKNESALEAKRLRYNSLREIIEEINKNLDLDYVADSLTTIIFSTIAHNKGVCNLYLIDSSTQKLYLFKSKKEDKNLVIRAKEADIFDIWVLRHNSSLWIEDIRKDFRFDLEKLKRQDLRPISSLISAPLISEQIFLGILRLDNSQGNFYSQDDLRFLVKISELGAVAIENSILFKRTQELAIHDELTSVYTKAYFLEYLKEECSRCIRKNRIFSVLMLDIDFFKNYNDKFGHTAGDTVLKRLSQKIIESFRELNHIVSRFGGEEFCVILENVDKKEAFHLADNLRKNVEKEELILRKKKTNVTVSIGIATFPSDGIDENELIRNADKAMYQAKQMGRNKVCCL
jgi:diguanylate cyclase (GGDEF)-like protein